MEPDKVRQRKPSAMSRSDRKVIRRTLADFPTPTPHSTPCRLFQGSVGRTSYGRHWIKGAGGHQQLHRWVWEQVNGPIPDGLYVCHKCDQPLCYRLDHLFLGTPEDNSLDMAAKARWNNQYRSGHTALATHCKHGHEFTPENTYVRKDTGSRMCRACHNATQKRLEQRKREKVSGGE